MSMKKLFAASVMTLALTGASFAQSTAPAAGAGGDGAASPHAKMLTEKGYTMGSRMDKRNDHTIYWVEKSGKPYHVRVYNDGRITEHEGNTPSGS